MEFDAQGLGFMTLAEALGEAEQEAIKVKEPPNLDSVLTIALVDAQSRHVKEIWRSVMEGEMLDSSRKLADLVALDSETPPQAVGYALVQACREGNLICVRRLREIQREQCSWSLLVALFNAFGILKAAEAGHVEVVQELLRPMESASTALMGYMLATRWSDKDGSKHYPFVENPENPPAKDWMLKVWSSKAMLPQAKPIFQAGWNLVGHSSAQDCFHEVIRSCYGTYLVWRVSVVAASQCHADVFRALLKRRWLDNLFLKETLSFFSDATDEIGSDRLDYGIKKIVADRAKMDTLMYQLVEEYCTKNYHDAMLFTLWKCCVSKKSSKDDGKPKCQVEPVGGIWEIKLEVPLLMMVVAHAARDEEPKDRYKHLTMLYGQTAQLSIQLLHTVVLQGDFLQVSVAVKQVRFKAENSRWDDACMGHFPSGVRVSVLPFTNEGSSVTLTNSSSNAEYTVGRSENMSAGTNASLAPRGGLGVGFGASASQGTSILMSSKPWRFEQVPLPDDNRGGCFQWTLQAMKGIPFDRANPIRMAESNSMWRWGRRVGSNPLDELPFTSEGGVQFTNTEFPDTMIWRFPNSKKGKKLRWRIEGEVYMTYTTGHYFETRSAKFSGDVEDSLEPEKPDFESKMKKFKEEVEDMLGIAPPDEKPKPEKEPSLAKFNTTMKKQFLEWLEFKKELDEMQGKKIPKERLRKKEEDIKEGEEEEEEEEKEAEAVAKETLPKEEVKTELKFKSSNENLGSSSRPSLTRVTASRGAEGNDAGVDDVQERATAEVDKASKMDNRTKSAFSCRTRVRSTHIPPEETVEVSSGSSRRGRNYTYSPPEGASQEYSVDRNPSVRNQNKGMQIVEADEEAPVSSLSGSECSANHAVLDKTNSNLPLSSSYKPSSPSGVSGDNHPDESSRVSSTPSLSRLRANKGRFGY